MGEVYLAHDTKLDRKVALEILPVTFAAKRDRNYLSLPHSYEARRGRNGRGLLRLKTRNCGGESHSKSCYRSQPLA
jgi:hypothetical protein